MCYYPFFPGTDLPDDDYTTLVPPLKPINGDNRKSTPIPIIIGGKENEPPARKMRSASQKPIDRRNITIVGISRRRSTIDQDSVERTRSAPSSPAQSRDVKQRANNNQTALEPIENDSKSVSSEHGSISNSGPIESLSSGSLEVRLKLDAKSSKMWVFVIKASLEMNQRLSKQTLVQIHLTVLPNKRIRFRTRAKPIDNAMFAEEFFCKVAAESIHTQGIRFRLYTSERFKREKLLAEATLQFGTVNLEEDMCKIVPFERAYPSDDSDLGSRSRTGSVVSHSRQNSITRSPEMKGNTLAPELEIGLAYDKTQAMFTLEIGKGINFGLSSQGRAPDTYVQIVLCNAAGEEIVSNRTVTRHGQHNPVYAERYPFNIQENLLDQITFLISVVNKKASNKTDRDFGWVSFGHNSSGKAQASHWEAMRAGVGETITRWHVLSEK